MSDHSTRLEEVITEYLRSLDTDLGVDRQALTEQHPDLAEELEAFFQDHDRMEQIARDVRVRTGFDTGHELPRSFGDYELLEEIARGGMGLIWKAHQRSLDRVVALKMLLPGHAAGSEFMRRFQIEAEAVADLSHKNIVPIYEIGEQEGQHFFSMKLIQGGNLSEHVEALRQDPRAAARLMITVAHAIRFAHQRGILHRDLKPANILMDEDGEPLITDFGLAKRDAEESGLTMTGAVMGTASYMAPEQASGQTDRLTWAADVYSLGAILYQLLTGVPPFRAATSQQTLREVCEKEPVKPSERDPSVDRDLETICLKCLEKDPERRYESAKGFADDLDSWLNGYPIQARRIGYTARTWRWCRRNRALAGLLVSTCALLLMAMTWLLVHVADIQQDRKQLFQAAVESQADIIGIRLENIERIVKQYRTAAGRLMTPPPDRLPYRDRTSAGREGAYFDEDYYDETLRPPGMYFEEAYETKVSWDHATVVRSPRTKPEDVAEAQNDAIRLARLNDVFSQVHPQIKQDITWSLAGSSSGIMVGYPGFGRYREKPNFDPVERTWYKAAIAAETDRPIWTRPYADASTRMYMISCVASEQLPGKDVVVGVDVPVKRIQEWLRDSAIMTAQPRCLVLMPFDDEDGVSLDSHPAYRVFVDTRYATSAEHWESVLNPPSTEELQPPLREYVRDIIDRQVGSGSSRSVDGTLMAHAYIEPQNWIVVAVSESNR